MKSTEKSQYEITAESFLSKNKIIFDAKLVGHDKYFDGDKDTRDIYAITLSREGKMPFVFRFGQSVADSGPSVREDSKFSRSYQDSGRFVPNQAGDYAQRRKAPAAYDVLACLTKYDVGTFESFCSDFGYDTDSRKAEKLYFAVQNEWVGVRAFFTPGEISELAEIQ